MGLACNRNRGQGPLGNRSVAVSVDGKTHTIRCIFEAPSPKELVDGIFYPKVNAFGKEWNPDFYQEFGYHVSSSAERTAFVF